MPRITVAITVGRFVFIVFKIKKIICASSLGYCGSVCDCSISRHCHMTPISGSHVMMLFKPWSNGEKRD